MVPLNFNGLALSLQATSLISQGPMNMTAWDSPTTQNGFRLLRSAMVRGVSEGLPKGL